MTAEPYATRTEEQQMNETRTIAHMLTQWLALGPHLAEQSRDREGNRICCVCGTTEQLVCVEKGWGGAYACRACDAETAAGEHR